LLVTICSRKIKRYCAFSQIVTMLRTALMYYIDFIAFMENPGETWSVVSQSQNKESPPKRAIAFRLGGLLLKIRIQNHGFTEVLDYFCALFKVYRTAIKSNLKGR